MDEIRVCILREVHQVDESHEDKQLNEGRVLARRDEHKWLDVAYSSGARSATSMNFMNSSANTKNKSKLDRRARETRGQTSGWNCCTCQTRIYVLGERKKS